MRKAWGLQWLSPAGLIPAAYILYLHLPSFHSHTNHPFPSLPCLLLPLSQEDHRLKMGPLSHLLFASLSCLYFKPNVATPSITWKLQVCKARGDQRVLNISSPVGASGAASSTGDVCQAADLHDFITGCGDLGWQQEYSTNHKYICGGLNSTVGPGIV